jgi:hypothetical protein
VVVGGEALYHYTTRRLVVEGKELMLIMSRLQDTKLTTLAYLEVKRAIE